MQKMGEAFSYQFKDKQWVNKFLLGSLFIFLAFFIIPIPFLIGYMLQNIRNAISKAENPMPEWKDLGKMYVDGLKFFVYCLGYSIPVLLIIFVMIFGIILSITLDEPDLMGIFMIPFFGLQGLIMIYALLMNLITPVLYIKHANGEPAKNLYNFKEIYDFIKNNIANILIAIVLNMAAGFIVNIGMMVFFIGLFPAAFYALTVMSYAYGQIYLEAKK